MVSFLSLSSPIISIPMTPDRSCINFTPSPPNSFLWAQKAKDKGKQRMISTTKIMPASTAKCRKCSKFRPEVSYWVPIFKRVRPKLNQK